MMFRWIAVCLIALGATAAFACGDDGNGGDGASPTAGSSPAASGFDAESISPEVLASAILRTEDLGEEFSSNVFTSPPQEGTSALNAQYSDGKIRVQSSIIAYSDQLQLEDQFQENRLILPGSGRAIESNYSIPNMATAYQYRMRFPDGQASFAIAQNFMIFVFLQTVDKDNPDPRSVDEALFRRLADTVGERMKPLLDDPASVTPMPELLTPAAGAATPAANATPAATP